MPIVEPGFFFGESHLQIFNQAEYFEGQSNIDICDWNCGREGPTIAISLDGRAYQVCPDCLEELKERFDECDNQEW